MDTVLEFHTEASQATVSEVLAQGHYVAARAEFESTSLRTKGIDSTNGSPHPTMAGMFSVYLVFQNRKGIMGSF